MDVDKATNFMWRSVGYQVGRARIMVAALHGKALCIVQAGGQVPLAQ